MGNLEPHEHMSLVYLETRSWFAVPHCGGFSLMLSTHRTGIHTESNSPKYVK